jgi:hypothetical protein
MIKEEFQNEVVDDSDFISLTEDEDDVDFEVD